MGDRAVTAAINAALRGRFKQPEWALLFNVADGTGAAQSRWADAVAMSLWPSRGLDLHGIEVKASRGDWQRERKDPEKAETIARFCDFWWLVAAKGVAHVDEVPTAWGLMEYDNGALKKVRDPARTEAAPLDRRFLAAMLRRASEVDKADLDKLVEVGVAERSKIIKQNAEHEIKNAAHAHQNLIKAVADFEQASGVKIEGYRGEEIGRAVKVVLSLGLVGTYGPIITLAQKIESAGAEVRAAIHDAGIEPPPEVDWRQFTTDAKLAKARGGKQL